MAVDLWYVGIEVLAEAPAIHWFAVVAYLELARPE